MEFKTNLFKLLNSDAIVIIDGYEIETVEDAGAWDTKGEPILTCSCDDDNQWSFVDQDVVVSEGSCKAVTAKSIFSSNEEPVEVCLDFFVKRPLQMSDL